MLTFRAIGDWNEAAVSVSWVSGTRVVRPRVQTLIDAAWQGAQHRENIFLFDGPMCRLERFDATDSGLDLQVSRTSYREFLGTNMSVIDLAAEFGPDVYANPIGLS